MNGWIGEIIKRLFYFSKTLRLKILGGERWGGSKWLRGPYPFVLGLEIGN